MTFGIIEIPIHKYALPISPTMKLRGLEVGKIYFRRGSANTEALGMETININDWLKSLPEQQELGNLGTEIATLLKRTTNQNENLSTILADVLSTSKKYKLNSLAEFATLELQGFTGTDVDKNPDAFKYRIQNIFISPKKLEVTVSFNGATSSQLKSHLAKDDDFYNFNLLFPNAINSIESFLNNFNTNPNYIVAIMSTKSSTLFPKQKGKDYSIYCYAFQDTFKNLYQSIRQKIINRLIEV